MRLSGSLTQPLETLGNTEDHSFLLSFCLSLNLCPTYYVKWAHFGLRQTFCSSTKSDWTGVWCTFASFVICVERSTSTYTQMGGHGSWPLRQLPTNTTNRYVGCCRSGVVQSFNATVRLHIYTSCRVGTVAATFTSPHIKPEVPPSTHALSKDLLFILQCGPH
jgi:hypothetical protein